MGVIWQIALSNAVLVAAGTPIVWLVGRYARRPALTHGLAVILLLKLITPPLWRVPVSWPEETPVPATPIEKQVASTDTPQMPVDAHESFSPSDLQVAAGSVIVESSPAVTADPPPTIAPASAPTAPAFDFARWLQRSIPIAAWIWAAGSVLSATVAISRVVRFTRALRFATRARDVQPRADLLARRLGLRHSPAVWFVPAFVSPMLWDLGRRPRLLLPAGLWERLDIAGRDTILLHELAHWRRGDHLVRWIELLATCLYWWHPACWWARRELREAEEQCCDAWVLWALPGVFKNYANALLEAVEFASIGADRPSARTAVPVLASRMGQFVHLRRRLTMLKHGNIARALSWGGLAGVMTLASIVLPLAPTWGQEQPATDSAQGRPAASAVEVAPGATAPEATPPATPADPFADRQRQAHNQLEAAELAQAHQTIAQLKLELRAANERLAALEARVRQGADDMRSAPVGIPKAQTDSSFAPSAAPAPAAPGEAMAPPAPRIQRFWRAEPDSVRTTPVPMVPPGDDVNAPAPTPPTPAPYQQYRVIIRDPATGRIKEMQTGPMPGAAQGQSGGSESERLDRIEAQLRMLMDEIAVMRQPSASAPSLPSPGPAAR